jgi:hypothetical protein
MSERFPGGVISKTAPVPTGPYENGTAPGIWTLEQQAEFVRQGIWPIAGNVPNYIEDVFSTWLYTGNGSTQTITNGVDLAGKGGLVWIKPRSGTYGADNHILTDTVRGSDKNIYSNLDIGQTTTTSRITAFNSNGFSLQSENGVNNSATNYASWTFREQPKFFDVVTFTTGTSLSTNRRISHNLGSVPGCILVKRTTGSQSWLVYHRSTGRNAYLLLDTTEASTSFTNAWGTSDPTSTDFGINEDSLCFPSSTYVAYLFAHDSGGFGLTGTDNVISCGSFTASGSGGDVNLGYEPQWVMIKRTDSTGSWRMLDIMRGYDNSDTDAVLLANTSSAETSSQVGTPFASGFREFLSAGTYIYIAIRRGPMKVPTSGTSVFAPVTTTSSANPLTVTTGFPVDLSIQRWTADGQPSNVLDRLRGGSRTSYARLLTTSTDAELTGTGAGIGFDSNTTEVDNGWISGTTNKKIYWTFRRAPGFFDEVCYTGNSTAPMNVPHNLGVTPQLIIIKNRSGAENWNVFNTVISDAYGGTGRLFLNLTDAYSSTGWVAPIATSTAITLDTGFFNNQSGTTYVAYLFASCPGVSKVGSYTGTGATQVINCGFTAGARFVLIKATSTTGNWLVWDSARGIVSGNDPYLLLNSTAAEVTSTDWVDTAATGFELSNAGGNLANSNGVSYIFLAIA